MSAKDKLTDRASELIDLVSKQLQGADKDNAIKWIKDRSSDAADWARDNREQAADFLRNNDQVQAAKRGAITAGRKAKENPLLTAAAVAAVAAVAYKISKRRNGRED